MSGKQGRNFVWFDIDETIIEDWQYNLNFKSYSQKKPGLIFKGFSSMSIYSEAMASLMEIAPTRATILGEMESWGCDAKREIYYPGSFRYGSQAFKDFFSYSLDENQEYRLRGILEGGVQLYDLNSPLGVKAAFSDLFFALDELSLNGLLLSSLHDSQSPLSSEKTQEIVQAIQKKVVRSAADFVRIYELLQRPDDSGKKPIDTLKGEDPIHGKLPSALVSSLFQQFEQIFVPLYQVLQQAGPKQDESKNYFFENPAEFTDGSSLVRFILEQASQHNDSYQDLLKNLAPIRECLATHNEKSVSKILLYLQAVQEDKLTPSDTVTLFEDRPEIIKGLQELHKVLEEPFQLRCVQVQAWHFREPLDYDRLIELEGVKDQAKKLPPGLRKDLLNAFAQEESLKEFNALKNNFPLSPAQNERVENLEEEIRIARARGFHSFAELGLKPQIRALESQAALLELEEKSVKQWKVFLTDVYNSLLLFKTSDTQSYAHQFASMNMLISLNEKLKNVTVNTKEDIVRAVQDLLSLDAGTAPGAEKFLLALKVEVLDQAQKSLVQLGTPEQQALSSVVKDIQEYRGSLDRRELNRKETLKILEAEREKNTAQAGDRPDMLKTKQERMVKIQQEIALRQVEQEKDACILKELEALVMTTLSHAYGDDSKLKQDAMKVRKLDSELANEGIQPLRDFLHQDVRSSAYKVLEAASAPPLDAQLKTKNPCYEQFASFSSDLRSFLDSKIQASAVLAGAEEQGFIFNSLLTSLNSIFLESAKKVGAAQTLAEREALLLEVMDKMLRLDPGLTTGAPQFLLTLKVEFLHQTAGSSQGEKKQTLTALTKQTQDYWAQLQTEPDTQEKKQKLKAFDTLVTQNLLHAYAPKQNTYVCMHYRHLKKYEAKTALVRLQELEGAFTEAGATTPPRKDSFSLRGTLSRATAKLKRSPTASPPPSVTTCKALATAVEHHFNQAQTQNPKSTGEVVIFSDVDHTIAERAKTDDLDSPEAAMRAPETVYNLPALRFYTELNAEICFASGMSPLTELFMQNKGEHLRPQIRSNIKSQTGQEVKSHNIFIPGNFLFGPNEPGMLDQLYSYGIDPQGKSVILGMTGDTFNTTLSLQGLKDAVTQNQQALRAATQAFNGAKEDADKAKEDAEKQKEKRAKGRALEKAAQALEEAQMQAKRFPTAEAVEKERLAAIKGEFAMLCYTLDEMSRWGVMYAALAKRIPLSPEHEKTMTKLKQMLDKAIQNFQTGYSRLSSGKPAPITALEGGLRAKFGIMTSVLNEMTASADAIAQGNYTVFTRELFKKIARINPYFLGLETKLNAVLQGFLERSTKEWGNADSFISKMMLYLQALHSKKLTPQNTYLFLDDDLDIIAGIKALHADLGYPCKLVCIHVNSSHFEAHAQVDYKDLFAEEQQRTQEEMAAKCAAIRLEFSDPYQPLVKNLTEWAHALRETSEQGKLVAHCLKALRTTLSRYAMSAEERPLKEMVLLQQVFWNIVKPLESTFAEIAAPAAAQAASAVMEEMDMGSFDADKIFSDLMAFQADGIVDAESKEYEYLLNAKIQFKLELVRVLGKDPKVSSEMEKIVVRVQGANNQKLSKECDQVLDHLIHYLRDPKNSRALSQMTTTAVILTTTLRDLEEVRAPLARSITLGGSRSASSSPVGHSEQENGTEKPDTLAFLRVLKSMGKNSPGPEENGRPSSH